MDDGSEHKKAKGTKKCKIKRILMFENYKNCLFNDETIRKPQQILKFIIMICTPKKSMRSR